MSCSKRNLRNMDTTIYRETSNCCGCDDYSADAQSDDMFVNSLSNYSKPVYQVTRQYSRPCCPVCPPVPPLYPPIPPITPPVNVSNPTTDYALFYSTPATDATYAAGTTIPVPTTLYNTAIDSILNNPAGTIMLLGGPTGRTFLVNYQVSGTNSGTTLGLNVNGTVPANSYVAALDGASTVSGRYIVDVPANSATSIALQVVAGTLTTTADTASTNLSVVRIR
ncbi:MAG: hypothetical protein NC213_01995 [Acetobacter sp.]|nr:hypothetical protein [Bacteroides sp.]MCM1340491.1 hypothetical protein [Acetobacter sp.]MCM1433231.1 hypothetical protein [Clostridiales bacterium]